MMVDERWVVDVWRSAGVLALALWLVVWFASLSTWKYALGPEVSAVWTRRWRVWLSVAAFAVGAWMMVGRLQAVIPGRVSGNPFMMADYASREALDQHPMDVAMRVVELWCVGLLAVLGAGLGVKVYEKWVNGRLSEAERRAGREGVRAWLGGWNLVLVLGIAVCAWLGYGYPFLAALLVAASAVLAYPVAVSAMTAGGAEATPPPAADLSPERERVLRLLEEGRVTAEEAAELLSALGATLPPPAVAPAAEPWTPGRKLMVMGAAVVLVGFFLPWFEIDLGREMRQAMSQAVGAMPVGAEMQGMVAQGGDAMAAGTPTVRVAGGDVGHGLGWIVLGLGVGAALAPMLLPALAREQRRAVMTVALAGGAIILLYLLTGNFSRVSFGLPVVIIGYAAEIVGLLRDQFAWQVPVLPTAAQAV